MQKPDAQYPILIWALTIRGEIMAVHCTNRAEALEIGRANVASGAWRTWDAFESSGDATEIEARKIACSDEQPANTPRPRILADWTPPAPPAPELPREPMVKETLKGLRAGATQEKPKGTRRRRIIPD
jgi:hypothetical protein